MTEVPIRIRPLVVEDIEWDYKPRPGGNGHQLEIDFRYVFGGAQHNGNITVEVYDHTVPVDAVVHVDIVRSPIVTPDVVRREYSLAGGKFQWRKRDVVRLRIRIYAYRGTRIVAIAKWHPSLGNVLKPGPNPITLLFRIDYDVIVVQDVAQLPQWGELVDQAAVFPGLQIGPPGAVLGQGRPLDLRYWFIVQYRPNGVDISWLGTGQKLRISLKKPEDGKSGFALSFPLRPRLGRDADGWPTYNNLLHIRVAGAVEITLSEISIDRNFVDEKLEKVPDALEKKVREVFDYQPTDARKSERYRDPTLAFGFGADDERTARPLDRALFFRLQRVDHVAALPEAGSDFAINPNDDIAPTNVLGFYKDAELGLLGKLAVDIVAGAGPWGMFVDYAELLYMLDTGKDKWDQPVHGIEMVLQGIFIVPAAGDTLQAGTKILKALR